MGVDVSIIIPNYNSPVIGETISSLLSQSFTAKFEIIIVGVDSLALIKEGGMVKFVNTKKRVSPAEARNIGVKIAQSNTIVFLDADCIPEKDWLKELMNNPNEIVNGAVEFRADNTWSTIDNFAHFHELNKDRTRSEIECISTIQMKISKEKILSARGFNENLEIGEDRDFSMRLKMLGYRLYFEPRAIVKHYPDRKSFISILRHSMIWGKSSLEIRLRYNKFPKFLKNKWLLLFTSPILAMGATLRIFFKKYNMKFFIFSPIIFLTKLFWIFGGVKGLRNGNY